MKGVNMKQIGMVFIVLFLSATLFGYVIYLKDGSTYVAKEKYKVDGEWAIITLQNNTVIRVKLNLIDVKKTQEYSERGLTGGEVIEMVQPQRDDKPSDSRRVSPMGDLATRSPRQTDFGAPSARGEGIDIRSGSGVKESDKVPFNNKNIASFFSKNFENQNLFQYRIYQGLKPSSMRLEVTTDNESEVFKTITTVARSLSDIKKRMAGSLDQVELFMVTSTGAPAGRFIVDTNKAEELADKKIKVESFYVQHVIF